MKKAWVDEECIACGACVEVCPEVFKLEGEFAEVREDADLGNDRIVEAAEACPVDAIHYEE